MAHELDTREDGEFAFVGRAPAWHQGGTVITDRNITLEEALKLGGADFDVGVVPIFTKRVERIGDSESGETIDIYSEVEGHRATMRMDRQRVLGTVRSRYTPLQNADAFGVFAPLVDNGVARIESAGTLREGRDVWLLVRFDIDSEIVRHVFRTDAKDPKRIIPYGLISNNHAGQRQVQMQETPVYVVCANTLGMAQASFKKLRSKGKAFSVRHTLNVEAKTVEAAQAMYGDLINRYETIARQYHLLHATHLDTALFRKLVLDIASPFEKRHEKDGMTKREQTGRERIEERRDRLTKLWTAGTGMTGNHSAWEAYNAVTESVDFDTTLWRTRGGDDGRMEAMFDGRLADVKQDTLDALVGYAMLEAERSPEGEVGKALVAFD